jgi:hypothetical protein
MCTVNAQSTNLVINETNGFFSFTVTSPGDIYASPDPGTINTITVVNQVSGENYEAYLSTGDTVVVSYTGFVADDLVFDAGSGYLYYLGPADSVIINAVEIPEFPAFLILPLSMVVTLVALMIYKRKQVT